MLSIFDLAAILLTLTAAFGWVNRKLVGLPATIGLLLMGLLASLLLLAVDLAVPQQQLHGQLAALVGQIDFYDTVMNGMLALLLFAGALHVDLTELRDQRWAVALTATAGVAISTALVGGGIWLAAEALGMSVPLPWALVFGALISPTDPVAVLSTLKSVRVPAPLQVTMKGESLFNDGVGIVLFTILVDLAAGGGSEPSLLRVGELFFVEALGGALLGLGTGYLAYRAMYAIDEYGVEVLISLALVTGTYALAQRLGLSGPIAVVVAGLLIGNRGTRFAMSERTLEYLCPFWTLVDEILNSVLFLLIGLEVLVLRLDPSLVWLAAAAVPVVLAARLVAVAVPIRLLALLRLRFGRGTVRVLTWGGVRGGISVALALSLPEVAAKSPILAATYAVVVFSIVVQGLTLAPLVRRATNLEAAE